MAKTGKHYVYKQLEWWAEHGLIYMEDHSDDTFQALMVRDALERAAALTVERRRLTSRIVSSGGSSGNKVAAQERDMLQTAIEGLIEAAKEAKKQGDPSDPRVIEDLQKQRRKRILMPGENPMQKDVHIALPGDNVSGQKLGPIWLG